FGRGQNLSPAAHGGRQGPGTGYDELLRSAPLDRAVAEDGYRDTAKGMETVSRGSRPARRALRMHSVRLLFGLVSELLVELRPVSRAGHPAPGLPMGRRQPRRGHGRTARQSRRSVPTLPLPHNHELRQSLPQGFVACQGYRRTQEADG